MNNKEVEEHQTKMHESFENFCLERGVIKERYEIKAIGYLSINEKFDKGEVSQAFISKLNLVWHAGLVLASCGCHTCEFCNNATSSSEKTLLDKKNKIEYYFPQMIFHYIEVHKFKPSNEFIDFIMRLNLDELRIQVKEINDAFGKTK